MLVRRSCLALLFAPALFIASRASAAPLKDPLRFFEGRTEIVGVLKAVMHKPVRVHTIGSGTIEPDGSLTLVQHVEDEGQAPHVRTWRIRQVGPGKFSGTMSEAIGPVTIEQIDSGYLFHLKLPGGLSVEEWLFPQANGKSGIGRLIVRKLGFAIAKSETTIHRLSQEANNGR